MLAARRIAHALAEHGQTVVAELARGIDTVAMAAAIESGGNVIGTPIDRYYPKEKRSLQDQVIKDHLLVSQVPIHRYDHQPFNTRRRYFTERNATMAALCKATVIVEAGETSGTRTQARACMTQRKRLVFLPSVVESTTWAKGYLKRGITVATNVSDVMRMVG